MLAHWFTRSGIGQLVAPDPNIAQNPPPDDSEDLLQFFAPDPNVAPSNAPPSSAFRNGGSFPQQVQCQHCQKWTSVAVSSPASNPPVASTPSNRTSGARSMETPFMTPTPSKKNSGSMFSPPTGAKSNVEHLVLSAARDTARATFSPPPYQKSRDKVFRFCTTIKMDNKLATRLQKILTKDPSLLHARAIHMGQQAPDGFTPIMAAAYSGSTKSAQILLDIADTHDVNPETSILLEVDYHGRTALHLAAEFGHTEVVQILLPKYQIGTAHAPVDLTGRTALGRAITSPQPSARKNRGKLEKALYKPGDLSIIGVFKPEIERTTRDEDLRLAYGVADMPGMRVTMEDAMCMARFGVAGKSYCLLGVCDGHGDQGNVSDFVATQVPQVLQSHLAAQTTTGDIMDWNAIWKTTCLEVDEKLKTADLAGGSTAVFALISHDLIVVANVGDSRAILIQSAAPAATGLEEPMKQMAVGESSEGYPATIDEDEPQQATPNDSGGPKDPPQPPATGSIVIALSDDHKPNLPEEEARIQNAGMKVVPITFEDEGQEVTIHKVAKTDIDMLAVSRAFGDFEYKSNTTLPPEEQAVTAVPDIRIHSRDQATDLYMVLACDGIWDVCENDMVKDFVLDQVEARREISDTVLPEVGDALLRVSLDRGSKDNMSTIVVALSNEVAKIRPVITGKALDFS
jgi:serine/threonine protein phosphatase PrpC